MNTADGKNRPIVFHISTAAIFKLLFVFLAIVFLYMVREVVAIIFAALIFSLAFDPWINRIQSYRVPRALAIVSVYLVLIAAFTVSIMLLIPPLTQQVADIAENFPEYYQKIVRAIEDLDLFRRVDMEQKVESGLGQAEQWVGTAFPSVLNVVMNIFGGIVSLILILVLTFYFMLEEQGLKRFVKSLTPRRQELYVLGLLERMQARMNLWLRGQVMLSLIIGLLTFIGLEIIGIKYALLLAILAGLFEIVPFIGPLISAIPAVFFALAQSPSKALLTVIVYLIVQQLENHVLTPRVLGGSVNMNPLVVLVVVLIGAQIGGVLGILLAVPVASALSILLGDLIKQREAAEDLEEARAHEV